MEEATLLIFQRANSLHYSLPGLGALCSKPEFLFHFFESCGGAALSDLVTLPNVSVLIFNIQT